MLDNDQKKIISDKLPYVIYTTLSIYFNYAIVNGKSVKLPIILLSACAIYWLMTNIILYFKDNVKAIMNNLSESISDIILSTSILTKKNSRFIFLLLLTLVIFDFFLFPLPELNKNQQLPSVQHNFILLIPIAIFALGFIALYITKVMLIFYYRKKRK
ncbi:MAG: hypothetical protein WCW77_01470 [Patescibacteria group bacterium]|jgi:hypothetical protein